MIPGKTLSPIAQPTFMNPQSQEASAVSPGRTDLSSKPVNDQAVLDQSEKLYPMTFEKKMLAKGSSPMQPSLSPQSGIMASGSGVSVSDANASVMRKKVDEGANSRQKKIKNGVEKSMEKQLKAQAAARAKRSEARKLYLAGGLPGKETRTVSNDKFDAYVMNTRHPVGGHKARVIHAATGFRTNDAYSKEDPEVARDAAARNPAYINDREEVKSQINRDVDRPVRAQPKRTDGVLTRADTKHRLVGPTGSLTVRAQWGYALNESTGARSDSPHLVTVQPADTSSDEE